MPGKWFHRESRGVFPHHGLAPPPLPPCCGSDQAKIVSAWNSSAQAYVGSHQEGEAGKSSLGTDVGYKLAARLVRSLSEEARPPVRPR